MLTQTLPQKTMLVDRLIGLYKGTIGGCAHKAFVQSLQIGYLSVKLKVWRITHFDVVPLLNERVNFYTMCIGTRKLSGEWESDGEGLLGFSCVKWSEHK